MKIIDISRELFACEPYPGDPAPKLARAKDMDKGADCNLGVLSMCLHNGTHIDAPLHFLPWGGDVCSIPEDAFIGPCTVVEVVPGIITGAFIERYFPPNGERILIKSHGEAFLHESAATALSYMGYKLVGTDANTIEAEVSGGRTHGALLGDNIAVLENLDLENVNPGKYFLVAPPLKISGAEASPIRAMLITDYIFWSGDKN